MSDTGVRGPAAGDAGGRGAAPRRAVPLLLWLLVISAALVLVLRARYVADLSAFLPRAPDATQRLLIDQLKSGLPARTLLLAIEGGTAGQRTEASKRLAAALRAGPHFAQIENGEFSAWADLGRWVFEHRYVLSPAVTPERFTAAGLREAIDDALSLLGTPAGARLKGLLERDPTGETQRIAERNVGAGGPRSEAGLWVSRDGRRALLVATVKGTGADIDAQAAALDEVQARFAQLGLRGLTLLTSGAPKFAVESRAQIEREVRLLAIAGTVLMSLLLLLAFGSPVALVVALLPVASGVVVGIAAVSLAFPAVHGVTLGFGVTLIGEGVDYAIYYLIQARGGAAAGRPGWRDWLQRGWPTVRLGLWTSICGFAALVFSGFPGLAQLGVFSVAGLVGAVLTTRWVLPVLLPDGARGTRQRERLGSIAAALLAALPRWRHGFTALGLAAAAVLVLKADRLWQSELASLSPISAEALALDASLRADLGNDEGGSLVVVQAPTLEVALQQAERVAARLDVEVNAGRLAGYRSVTHLLPSAQTQDARRAALPAAPVLQAALAEATRGGPLRAERLAPFVQDLQAARTAPPLTLQALQQTSLATLLESMLQQRVSAAGVGSWAVLMPLSPPADAPIDLDALRLALKAGAPAAAAQVLDIGGELRRLYAHYLGEAKAQALLGALAVLALIAYSLRSTARLLRVAAPLLLAVLLTMGGFAAAGVPLGILHLVGLLLVVAVGSNYALFFDAIAQGTALSAQPGAHTAIERDTQASLLLANLTTVLSFGLLALSAIPALSAIGRVVAPGALLGLLIAAAYAPQRPRRP